MSRFPILFFVLSLALRPAGASVQGGGEFILADPRGDDHGPGSYIYPKNAAFSPYHGLYDLLSFAVSSGAETVRFDLTLAVLRNPWGAPEGFSHQIIHVYIARGRGRGRTEPLAPGPYVRFSPAHPWDVLLKAAPWESSELLLLGPDGEPVKHPLQAGIAGRRTIRIAAPAALIGTPAASWRYYVLVGSYDGFGEDGFRPVMAEAGEWHFGGGRDDAAEPQILDILAPARGRYSQECQLGGFNAAKGELAMLQPVGQGTPAGGNAWQLVTILLVLLAAVGWWLWYAPARWRERVRSFLEALYGRVKGS